MTLPTLGSTLLGSLLEELPEETAQVLQALAQLATKYRTDLDAQLQSTLQFEKLVVHGHERLQRRLKLCVRSLDESNRALKTPNEDLDELEALSEQVMGKLIGVMDLLGTRHVDGDKFPLLQTVLGEDGFEVVDIGSFEQGREGHEEEDEGQELITSPVFDGAPGDEDETEDRLVQEQENEQRNGQQDEQQDEQEDEQDQDIEAVVTELESSLVFDGQQEEKKTHYVVQGSQLKEEHGDHEELHAVEHNTQDELSEQQEQEQEQEQEQDQDQDPLAEIEQSINRYKSKQLKSIPLPATSSSFSSLHSEDSTTVHGQVFRSPLKLNDSLKKFI